MITNRQRSKRSIVGALTAAFVLSVATPAGASPPTPIEVAGGGCPANSTVFVNIAGEPAHRLSVDERGNYAAKLEVPGDVGAATVTATCGGHSFSIRIPEREAVPDRSYVAIAGLVGGTIAIIGMLITLLRRRAVIDLRDSTHQPSPSGPQPEPLERPAVAAK